MLFARHLLVPVEGVTEFLGQRDGAGMTDLAAVVQRFLVSPAIAAIAMRDAGYVSGLTVKEWKPITTGHLATLYGWSDHYESLCDNPTDSAHLSRSSHVPSMATRRGGVGAGDRDFA